MVSASPSVAPNTPASSPTQREEDAAFFTQAHTEGEDGTPPVNTYVVRPGSAPTLPHMSVTRHPFLLSSVSPSEPPSGPPSGPSSEPPIDTPLHRVHQGFHLAIGPAMIPIYMAMILIHMTMNLFKLPMVLFKFSMIMFEFPMVLFKFPMIMFEFPMMLFKFSMIMFEFLGSPFTRRACPVVPVPPVPIRRNLFQGRMSSWAVMQRCCVAAWQRRYVVSFPKWMVSDRLHMGYCGPVTIHRDVLFLPSVQDYVGGLCSSCDTLRIWVLCLWTTAGGATRNLAAARLQVGMHGRIVLATVLILFLSWLAVPTAALATHGSFNEHHGHETAHTRATMCSGAAAAGGNVGVFNAFLLSGQLLTVGPDTFCDISMISPSKVDPAWLSTRVADPLWLDGIGGNTSCDVVVQVPLRLQWGAPVDSLLMYVGETPPGVDVILGRDMLNVLGGCRRLYC